MNRHWGLSIDRQAEQIRARDRLIRQLSVLALALVAIVFILAIMLIAATRVYASEACMTKAEARAAFPKSHIYWHGRDHCWNDRASLRYRVKHKQLAVDAGQMRAQQSKPQPDANGAAAKKILYPSLRPTIEFSFQALLPAEPMTAWPTLLDVDLITADPDPPLCCWPKLDRDFEARWNDMPQWWIAKLKEHDR